MNNQFIFNCFDSQNLNYFLSTSLANEDFYESFKYTQFLMDEKILCLMDKNKIISFLSYQEKLDFVMITSFCTHEHFENNGFAKKVLYHFFSILPKEKSVKITSYSQKGARLINFIDRLNKDFGINVIHPSNKTRYQNKKNMI